MSGALVIRRARPEDARALLRLAALDSAAPLAGDLLIAEVDGEPHAALSILAGDCIADPFRPTAELVDLLRLRAAQMAPPRGRGRGRGRRLRARLAPAT
ncbi:MAG: hypothetical protein QOJ07_1740 [Thermoleophilaceae bacterium]|nr:hypothetical protein [Thermoleophilaceae bacterium]